MKIKIRKTYRKTDKAYRLKDCIALKLRERTANAFHDMHVYRIKGYTSYDSILGYAISSGKTDTLEF
jgi:hypothetical protein